MNVTAMNRPANYRPLLLLAAALVVALGAALYFSGVWPRANAHITNEPISQALGAASRADVQIVIGNGKLQIGALGQPNELVAGAINYPTRNRVARTFAIEGDTATFALREQDTQADNLFKYKDDAAIWDLRLNSATPMRLALEAGVVDSTINLSQLHVTEFTLATEVGKTTLTLPRQGQVQAQISGQVSETIIYVPAGVAVRFENSGGFGNISVPSNYQRQGNVYVSPGYETAANRVDLNVSSSVGELVIVQDSE